MAKRNIFVISIIISFILFWNGLALAIDAPTNLTADCGGNINECPLSVEIDWDDVSLAVNYQIQTYKSKQSTINCALITEGNWKLLTDLPSESSIALSGLDPNAYYCVRVMADGISEQGAWVLGLSSPYQYFFKTQQIIISNPCVLPNACALSSGCLVQAAGDCNVGEVCCEPSADSGTDQTDDVTGDGSPVDIFGPIQSQSLEDLFRTVTNFLLVLAFTIGPLMIIYAGYLILTAGGDAQKMSKAKTIILWTLIALAIILFAKGLTSLVKGALGG